ncbi:unnamed protein product, partial [Dovyalis caffra]
EWKKRLTAGAILGFFLVPLLVNALYRVYSFNKIEREYQDKVEIFLNDYRAGKQTGYTCASLKKKKITNQFKDELGQGQGAYGTELKGKLTSEIPVAVELVNEKWLEEGRTLMTSQKMAKKYTSQNEVEEDAKIAKKLAIVGLWCIQWNPEDYPSLKIAFQMPGGEGDNLATPPKPISSTVPKGTDAALPG